MKTDIFHKNNKLTFLASISFITSVSTITRKTVDPVFTNSMFAWVLSAIINICGNFYSFIKQFINTNTNTNNCPDLLNPTFRHLGFFRDINKQVYDIAHRKTQCVTARHVRHVICCFFIHLLEILGPQIYIHVNTYM